MMQKNSFAQFLQIITSYWFAFVWLCLIVIAYFFVDMPVAMFMHNLQAPWLSQTAHSLSYFGLGEIYFILFVALLFVGRFVLKNYTMGFRSLYLFFCVLISGAICDLLKAFLGRSRPDLWFSQHIYGFDFFHTQADYLSFPSGHAVTITAVMIGLGICLPRMGWLCVLLAVLVSVSRVVLTAHFVSDIMAGMCLGAIVAIGMFHWLSNSAWKLPLLDKIKV